MKLKELLNQLRHHITPNPSTMYNEILAQVQSEQKNKSALILKWIACCAAIIIISTGLGWYIFNYFTYDSSVNIIGDTATLSQIVYVAPDRQVGNAAAPNTTVSIVTKERMSTKEAAQHISVSPQIPYTLRKTGANRFALKFDSPLESNTSYTINSLINDSIVYRWSIETTSHFKIENTYPTGAEIDINTAIEITFSESSVNGLEDHFTIFPEVNGKFIHNGRIWTFIPSQPLHPYTTYTVTVSKEIIGAEGTPLDNDCTFTFTTGASDDKWAHISNDTYDIADTFPSGVTPHVEVYAQGITSATADLTVYRLTDANAYLHLHKLYKSSPVISLSVKDEIMQNNYPIHSQFSVSIITDPQNDFLHYLNYPKQLESGYYVTEINWGGITMYQLVQISDLSVYAAGYNGDYVVWVNNTQTKLPVAKASVSTDNITINTDTSGIASFTPELSSDASGMYITVKSDTLLPYILYAENTSKDDPISADNYYYYFYTNSSLYRTTDTVKVWGAVFKRNSSATDPDLSLYAHWNAQEYDVDIDANGCFSLEIPIDNYRASESTDLSLRINGQDCYYKSLYILDYQLPAYSLKVASDKHAYFSDEIANFNINATYYDGSPVANLAIFDEDISVITDDQGNAVYSKALTSTDVTDCKPEIYSAYFESDPTIGSIAYTDVPVLIFNNTEYLQADLISDEDGYTLDIKTNEVTLDKLNAMNTSEYLDTYYDIPEELFLGKGIAKNVVIEIHNVTYDRQMTGSYYDPLLKKVQFEYEYVEKDALVSSQTISTLVGMATIENINIPETTGYCYIKLAMTDSAGKSCSVKLYVNQPIESATEQYEFTGTMSAALNEEITLMIAEPTSKNSLENGSFIYHVVGTDILKTDIGKEGAATFTFDQNCSPDITVFGAFFDGTHLHGMTPHFIEQNTEEKKLNISIQSDKTQYAPGETVTAEILITDHNGVPIQAAFNLNVADSALLKIAENYHDILNDLYAYRSPSEIYTSLPIQHYGAGGGGGACVRDNFEDTPAFLNGRTDKDGKATLSFQLSDSITSWTLVVQAVTENVCAGDAQTEISCTKEMFITSQIADTIKAGDDAVITYRCDGSEVSIDSTVETKIMLFRGDTMIDQIAVSHTANTLQYANFGKLTTGNYSVKIEITFGKLSDAIQVPFTVADSTLHIPAVTDIDLQGENATALLFVDESYSRYNNLINTLLQNGNSRIDYVIGQKYAQTITENFERHTFAEIDWSFLSNYYIDGGYAPYSANGQADLFLCARLASLFPEQIDREYALDYFDNVLRTEKSTYEEVLCALWGKAALHQAVESDLAHYYADGNGFTTEQHLYFALGYAYSGNQTKANDIYTNRIKPLLKSDSQSAYLEEKDATIQQRCNSMLALLLCRLSSTDADSVLNHILKNDSDTTLAALEIIGYLKEYVPLLEGKNSAKIIFSDNSEIVIEYDRCAPYSYQIPSNKQGKVSVEKISGNSVIKTNSTLRGDQLAKLGNKLGTILIDTVTEAMIGDSMLINITLDPSVMTNAGIQIALPNGIRYLQKFDSSDPTAYVYANANPSKLTLCASSKDPIIITLHCKAVIPGSFILEPIVCITDHSLSYYGSDPITITIHDPNNSIGTLTDETVNENINTPQDPVVDISPENPQDENVPHDPTPEQPEPVVTDPEQLPTE